MLLYKAYNNRLTCLHPTTAFLELKIYTSNWKSTQMCYFAHFWWQKVHAHTPKSASLMNGLRHRGVMQHSRHCFPRERSHSLCWCLRLLAVDLHISSNQSCGAASAGGQAFLTPHMEPQHPHISAHSQLSHCSRTCYTTHDLTVISWKCSISDKCEFIMLSMIQ